MAVLDILLAANSMLSSGMFWLTVPVIVVSLIYWWRGHGEKWDMIMKAPSPPEWPFVGTLFTCERDSAGT